MARLKIRNSNNKSFEKLYIKKNKFWTSFSLNGILLVLLGIFSYRLYTLGDFSKLLVKLTTYLQIN